MQLSIKDVLRLFQEKGISLIAGSAGLDNTISSVNITDSPDVLNWARPGDLILTTAYIAKDDPAMQESIIRDLASCGAAGIGIKTKRFLPEIPIIMKKVADELNFPILELPNDLSLAEIMNTIISNIAEQQAYLLMRTNEIHQILLNVAIQGGGLSEIISCLGKFTKCPVGCYDKNGALLSHWIPDTIPGIDAELLAQLSGKLTKNVETHDALQKKLSQTKSPVTEPLVIGDLNCSITSFPIISNNEFFGHISLLQTTSVFAATNSTALEQACIVAALDFSKQKAIAESRRLHSRDLLEHILFSNSPDRITSGILAGSKLTQARFFECLLIELDEPEKQLNLPVISSLLYKTTQQLVAKNHPMSLVSERTGTLIVLVAAPAAPDAQEPHISSLLHTSFSELYDHLKISISVGTTATSINSVRQSYEDASTVLYLGRKIKGTGQVTFPHEIASYSLLLNTESPSLLHHVCSPILTKLERADQTSGGELLKTLENYLECDKSLTDAANALFIHRNTLSNRLEKITDITNFDFSSRELSFCLRLALRQRKISRSNEV